MFLNEIYSKSTPVISYEIFPPKNDETGEKLANLYSELEKLKKYNPNLVSVTYGAGGSNRNQSLDMVAHTMQARTLIAQYRIATVVTGFKQCFF